MKINRSVLQKSAWVFAILALCIAEGRLVAQNSGTILGTVKDQSGAVLPGAAISIRNVETGTSRSSVSGARGEYRVPALNVGTYEVQVEMTGFQTGIRQGITLTVGREAVVDFSLSVGNVAEQVTVTGEAPLIETTTATVSGLVDPQQMREMPLNGRSFLELVPLQAGAVFAETGGDAVDFGYAKKLSIVGTRYNTNAFLLDGSNINDASGSSGSASGTMAGVETVREFRVVTNAYDAEYGNHTGGVISAVTKSGTNEFHGSIFEYLRNDNLDAHSWRNNKFGENKSPFARNQFGGSIGGPVIRDRTHFFGSYEGLREALGSLQTDTVPGATLLAGLIPITTGTGANVVRTGAFRPIPNGGQVKPEVMAILRSYPAPNVVQNNGDKPFTTSIYERPDGTGQRTRNETRYTTQDFITGRIDHRISDADSIFGRMTTDDSRRFTPGFSGTSEIGTANRYLTIEETHIYSPALLGRTHASFNRTNFNGFATPSEDFPFPKFTLPNGQPMPGGLGSLDGTSNVGSFGGFGIGLTGWTASDPKFFIQNNFEFKEDLFLSRGRNSLKFGGTIKRIQFNHRSDFQAGGNYSFASTENAFAGVASQFSTVRSDSDNIRGWRQTMLGLYLQDDVQVRPGLTVNMGLRYEIVSMPNEVNGKMANVRDITPKHLATLTQEQTDVGAPYILNPSLLNFAPRVGIAWSPFAHGKTSVRAGIGSFFEQILPGLYEVPGNRAAPFYAVAELIQNPANGVPAADFPYAQFTQQNLLLGSVGTTPQIDGIEFNTQQPATYKWSFDLSQQILADTTVEAGYSGTRSTHLLRGNLQLSPSPSTIVNGRRLIILEPTALRAAPNWGRVRWRIWDGTSDYHAFRTQITKRFSGGLQVQTSYTFAKSTDDGSAFLGSGDFTSDRQPYGITKEHALSSFDVRQSFYTNFVYELPVGRNWSGIPGTVLGGWSMSGVLRMNSGSPHSLGAASPRYRIPGTSPAQFVSFQNTAGPSLDLKPGGKYVYDARNPDAYYDITQFSFPLTNCMGSASFAAGVPAPCDSSLPIGAYQGNIAPNTLIGPGIFTLDFNLSKETKLPVLGESGNLQFRAEFFNLLNRPNFSSPGTNLFDRDGVPVAVTSTSGPGVITNTSGTSRQIQFALRLGF